MQCCIWKNTPYSLACSTPWNSGRRLRTGEDAQNKEERAKQREGENRDAQSIVDVVHKMLFK